MVALVVFATAAGIYVHEFPSDVLPSASTVHDQGEDGTLLLYAAPPILLDYVTVTSLDFLISRRK